MKGTRYRQLFCSRDLFIAGLLIMPSLLFNPSVLGRVAQFLLFWLFSALMGKKNAIVMTVLVIFSIVLFNVLTPYGQALFSIGAFTITKGAILTGIKRGVTLEGLVMLSKASVREDLHLPGGFGAIIGESFRIFALIMEQKQRIRPKTMLADLDALLLELDSTAYGIGSGQHEQSAALGIIVLIAAVCLSWGIFCGGLFFKW